MSALIEAVSVPKTFLFFFSKETKTLRAEDKPRRIGGSVRAFSRSACRPLSPIPQGMNARLRPCGGFYAAPRRSPCRSRARPRASCREKDGPSKAPSGRVSFNFPGKTIQVPGQHLPDWRGPLLKKEAGLAGAPFWILFCALFALDNRLFGVHFWHGRHLRYNMLCC